MFNTRKRMKETIETQAKLLKNRDKFIDAQCKRINKLETRVSDLEVQCEFLFNNLSKKKRELVDNGKAN